MSMWFPRGFPRRPPIFQNIEAKSRRRSLFYSFCGGWNHCPEWFSSGSVPGGSSCSGPFFIFGQKPASTRSPSSSIRYKIEKPTNKITVIPNQNGSINGISLSKRSTNAIIMEQRMRKTTLALWLIAFFLPFCMIWRVWRGIIFCGLLRKKLFLSAF